MSLYRYDAQSRAYVPISSAIILKWFNQAASGGATYQRLKVEGAKWVSSPVTPEEGYYDIEAVKFQKNNATVIIIHNASPQSKVLSIPSVVSEKLPAVIETALVAPRDDYSKASPPVQRIQPGENIEIPAYSVTRIAWEQ